MTEPTQDSAAAYATALLVHYGFELGGYKAEELVAKWSNQYHANWVRLAVIEALYQGRYKSVSVEQILAFWKRRSRALYHFNHEFERLICRKFPQNLADSFTTEAQPPDFPQEEPEIVETLSLSSVAGVRESELRSQETDTSSQSAGEMHPSSVSLVTPLTPPSPSTPLLKEDLTPVNKDDTPTHQLAEKDETTRVAQQQNYSQKVGYEADWSRSEAGKRPIDQFTPPPDLSDFYLKLKAVAQMREDLTEEDAFLGRVKSED